MWCFPGLMSVKLREVSMYKVLALALFAVAVSSPDLAGAADAHVDQVGKTFDPSELQLKAGDTITFHNSDDVTHNINVFDSDDNPDDKGLQKPGEDIKHTFTKPGEYLARCGIHPKMKMNIEVK